MKQLKCLRCNKMFEPTSITRLDIKEYGAGRYNMFATVQHYNICHECFARVLSPWLTKEWGKQKGGGSNGKV